MKAAVITFPGSNCDRDLAIGFERAGASVTRVWHKDASLPDGIDIVAIPGGFSFGDYLRCGAIAARAPVAAAITAFAARGGHVLGICNGFQVLAETRLLPGALMRNARLRFVYKPVDLKVDTANPAFTNAGHKRAIARIPVAHHDGNYTIDAEGLARLRGEDRIAFSYVENPNGSVASIAGVLSQNRRVLGMMPHPERMADPAHGGTDGAALFRSLMAAVATA